MTWLQFLDAWQEEKERRMEKSKSNPWWVLSSLSGAVLQSLTHYPSIYHGLIWHALKVKWEQMPWRWIVKDNSHPQTQSKHRHLQHLYKMLQLHNICSSGCRAMSATPRRPPPEDASTSKTTTQLCTHSGICQIKKSQAGGNKWTLGHRSWVQMKWCRNREMEKQLGQCLGKPTPTSCWGHSYQPEIDCQRREGKKRRRKGGICSVIGNTSPLPHLPKKTATLGRTRGEDGREKQTERWKKKRGKGREKDAKSRMKRRGRRGELDRSRQERGVTLEGDNGCRWQTKDNVFASCKRQSYW